MPKSVDAKDNASKSKQPVKKKVAKPHQIILEQTSQGWKNIVALSIAVLFLLSSVLVYVIVNNEAQLSLALVENTPLQNIIDLPLQATSTTSEQSNRPKIINRVLGLETNTTKPYDLIDVLQKDPNDSAVSAVADNTVIIRNTSTGQESHALAFTQDGLIVSASNALSQCENISKETDLRDGYSIIAGEDELDLNLVAYDRHYGISLFKNETQNWSDIQFLNPRSINIDQGALSLLKNEGLISNLPVEGSIINQRLSLDIGSQMNCDGGSFVSSNLISYSNTTNQQGLGHPVANSAGQVLGLYSGTFEGSNIIIPGDVISSVVRRYINQSEEDGVEVTLADFDHAPVLLNAQMVGEFAGRTTLLVSGLDQESQWYKDGLRDGDIIVGVQNQLFEYNEIIGDPLESYVFANSTNELQLSVLQRKEDNTYTRNPVLI